MYVLVQICQSIWPHCLLVFFNLFEHCMDVCTGADLSVHLATLFACFFLIYLSSVWMYVLVQICQSIWPHCLLVLNLSEQCMDVCTDGGLKVRLAALFVCFKFIWAVCRCMYWCTFVSPSGQPADWLFWVWGQNFLIHFSGRYFHTCCGHKYHGSWHFCASFWGPTLVVTYIKLR